MVSSSQLFQGLVFISDAFTNFSASCSALNVNGIEISAVVFVEGNTILERVLLRGLEDVIFLDLIFLNFISEDSLSRFWGDVLFTLRNLWRELFFFTVNHWSKWDIVIVSVRVSAIVAESIEVHEWRNMIYWLINLIWKQRKGFTNY